MDLEEKYLHLEVRVKALEEAQARGALGRGTATADDHGLEQIDRRFEQDDEPLSELDHSVSLLGAEINMLRTTAYEMSDGIAKINKDSRRRDLRIDKIEKRLDDHDGRFDSIESLLIRIDAELTGPQPN
ncbi:hypothetical protein AB0C27_17845 [Nonomuraea sp. NPDC048882]|uniref:hypothetical protein n=1 Tax=Nonomuraea sp. NPDC048882 TaxID=3154347 RepID=UPI0033F9282F